MAPHPVYTQIGALIRQRRKQLNLKQLNLAATLGISRGSLANVETGRQGILVHQLYRFAEALEMSPGDLLPSEPAPAPLRQDWAGKLPAGLKPEQREQVARLFEAAAPGAVSRKRGGAGAKPSKR